MYRRVVTTSAKRSFKRLPRQVREDLLEQTKILETNPLAGEKLSGSLHFADTRENFYQKLRRLFR
ncbi:MAG: hypothetical protein CO042_00745 [Parcubacteria group bacterium CG_4_9_14_0_2_um_filter_41_8]|nr:MAG: hypothetical protein CO042_00745 [Parcubacteria group bacterium CG_4_9_14_0_2_um_filter_41_8]